MILKICNKCGNQYPLTKEFFHVNKRRCDGFTSQCKKCRTEKSLKHYKTIGKYKEFGITQDQYNFLSESQGNVCAICKNPEISKSNKKTIDMLSIDHDHKTGKVRGLLCKKCNSILGHIEKYLTNPEKWDNYLKIHSKE